MRLVPPAAPPTGELLSGRDAHRADTDSATPPCRVLAVDPFPIVREALGAMVDAMDDAEMVGHAGSVAEALLIARRTDPDIVLIETGRACGNVCEELSSLLREHPKTRALVFSADEDPEHVRTALAAGAAGYVHKGCPIDELERAMRIVHAGERYVDPRLGARLATARGPTALDGLSAREREVITLLALGYANKEVAARLCVSVRTVETHRASLMAKLRITTRRELVAKALRAGLLREDAPSLEEFPQPPPREQRRQARPRRASGQLREPRQARAGPR